MNILVWSNCLLFIGNLIYSMYSHGIYRLNAKSRRKEFGFCTLVKLQVKISCFALPPTSFSLYDLSCRISSFK